MCNEQRIVIPPAFLQNHALWWFSRKMCLLYKYKTVKAIFMKFEQI